VRALSISVNCLMIPTGITPFTCRFVIGTQSTPAKFSESQSINSMHTYRLHSVSLLWLFGLSMIVMHWADIDLTCAGSNSNFRCFVTLGGECLSNCCLERSKQGSLFLTWRVY
jgi:hypothetical protein